MQAMNGRFFNVVVNKPGVVSFSLHRVNPATLFHPPGSPIPATPTMEDLPLPPAEANFSQVSSCSTYFMAFGRHREKILAAGGPSCFLYDTALRSFFPFLRGHVIYRPAMSVPIGDGGVCVLSPAVRRFVELTQLGEYPRPAWSWRSLPPPPYMYADGYDHDDDEDEDDEDDKDPFKIAAYAAVGRSGIWASTFGAGTYSYDTAERAWSKQGEWAMPFRGRAEYVPEHGLWFGFSDRRGELLCAADLAAVSAERRPVARGSWEDLMWLKEDAELIKTQLLPLGCGKLCVARFFLTDYEQAGFQDFIAETESSHYFMVLEGVEVVAEGTGGGLRMIRHKCHHYSFGPHHGMPV